MGNKKKYLLLSIALIIVQAINAQNQVGINQTSVDGSAVLEMFSTNKGLLLPRMSSNERRAISSPANGLMVYETSSNTFWHYGSSGWSELIADNNGRDGIGDADADTRIFLEFTSDNDNIRFYIEGTEHFRLIRKRFDVRNTGNSVFLGDSAGYTDDYTSGNNVYLGTSAGVSTNNSRRNVAIGYQALRDDVDETDNTVIGSYAVRNATDVRRTTAIGNSTLFSSSNSEFHTMIGHSVLENHTSGNNLVALGTGSFRNSVSCGSSTALGNKTFENSTINGLSVALGVEAGRISNVNFNIYLGYNAGAQNNTARRLFIANSNTTTPLLLGDFGNDILTLNGSLLVTGDLTAIGTITDVSDKRLKKDILKVEGSLEKLSSMNGYSYRFKTNDSREREYGLKAQEVQEVFPTLVRKISPNQEYLGVSYVQFIPLLLEAEKEQYLQLTELDEAQKAREAELDELEEEITALKAKLAAQAANR